MVASNPLVQSAVNFCVKVISIFYYNSLSLLFVHLCVCVCVRERERDRESTCVVLYVKINCELLIIGVFFISGDKVPSEILRLDSE